jgi:hypothetical protein
MAHGTGGFQINRVNVVEIVASRIELFQLFAAALRQNDVTQVATGGNYLLAVIRRVIAVMATETARRDFVADMVSKDHRPVLISGKKFHR